MAPVYAVDSSFDLLTREEAQRLKQDAGVELYIQCLWTGTVRPVHRLQSLENARMEGLAVAGYASLTWSGVGEYHMKEAMAGVPLDLQQALNFVAVDVELPGITIAQIKQARVYLLNAGMQKVPVYTSYNAWTTLVGPRNSSELAQAGVLLWNAFWDGQPDVDFAGLPFGGWSEERVVGEQWSGGTNVEGQFVDRNTFARAWLFPAPTPPASDPCGLVAVRARFLEECARAAADGDYATLKRWATFFGA